MNGTTYRSKTGVVFPVTLIMVIGVSAFFTYILASDGNITAAAVVIVLAVLASSLFLSFMLGTKYVLNDDHLRIIAWPLTDISIPYSDIALVKGVRNSKPAYALSHDRIRIEYREWVVHISPVRKKEFKDELISRCDGLDDKH